MPADTRQFKVSLDRFIELTKLNAHTVVARTVLELFDSITKKTPVDTGYARRGWFVSFDRPSNQLPSKSGGSGAPAPPAVPKDTTVAFITNNVPYIRFLEDGSSKQAPYGMVRVSVAEMQAKINTIVAQLEKS
jgi:hypothetical protein